MIWLFAVVLVVVMGATAVVAAGRGGTLGPAYPDRRDVLVPADRPLSGADVRQLRFTTALRGYRMAEVDALLQRLAAELDERDAARAAEEIGEGSADSAAQEVGEGSADDAAQGATEDGTEGAAQDDDRA